MKSPAGGRRGGNGHFCSFLSTGRLVHPGIPFLQIKEPGSQTGPGSWGEENSKNAPFSCERRSPGFSLPPPLQKPVKILLDFRKLHLDLKSNPSASLHLDPISGLGEAVSISPLGWRLMWESLEILLQNEVLNREKGINLRKVWLPILEHKRQEATVRQWEAVD